MKILISVASLSMLFLLPGLSFAQSASPVESWFSLTIGTPEAIATAGSDVKLKVRFTNDTGKNLYYAVGGPGRGGPAFDINVRDSQGNAVPETSYGLRMHGKDPRPWSGSVFRATSHSGETVEINLILSKEYDLSKPGKYTVQVQDRRPVVRPVKSNIVTITVLP
jgi:hypothetical protein